MGFSLSGGSSSNYGLIFVPLKAVDIRTKKGRAIPRPISCTTLGQNCLWFRGALLRCFEPPAIQGIGSFGGFQFELQDTGRNTLGDLDRVAHEIVGAGQAGQESRPDLYTSYTSNDPQLLVSIDREKAKAMGVSFSQISSTLGVFMGSQYVNNFDFNNRSYRVYVQADQPSRMTPSDLREFYVRSDCGTDDLARQSGHHRAVFRAAGDLALQPFPLGGDRWLGCSGL